MKEQEKRVLDLAKRYGDMMRKAKEDDPDLTPTTQEDYDAKTAKAEGFYNQAQDILEDLEDAIEEMVHGEGEFIPLTPAQRSDLYKHADILERLANRVARLRNAYYGMSASANTQADFDRWDSEIIGEENALQELERELTASQNKMGNW